MDIGSLTGAVELEDLVSERLNIISEGVKKFAETFEGAMGTAALGAVTFVTVVVGMIGTITLLGEKGSTILGVEDAFNRLAVAAGSTGEELLGGLNDGVKGTIDSMVLMQATSRALSAGVKLSADDMRVLGETARAMGKATGTDAAQGLETLSSALTTGQTRGLKMAGIIIDVKKAEEDFATSIGKTRDQLSDAGKLEAKRVAMLDAMRAKVQLLGVSELNFKERVQQGAVALGNWVDNLAKAVASSPDVLRAYDAMSEAIQKAFGGASQTLLATIVSWVNKFANAVTTYGPMVIRTLADIKDGVVFVWNAVTAAWDTVPDWFKNVARDAALAGGAVFLTSKAFGALGGSDILGTTANFATITSGLRDFTAVAVSLVPRAIVQVKGLYDALSVYYLLGSFAGGGVVGGIGGVLTGIGAGIAAVAASPLGLAALVAALGAAFVQLGEGVKNAGEAWRANKSMWDFFTAKEDDNFVRRWLGLTKTPVPPGKADVSQYQTAEQAAAALIKPPIVPPTPPDFLKNDFKDKVDALSKSWREASMSAKVFQAAFAALNPDMLANKDIQQMLLPEILKMNEAGKAIPANMRAEALAIIDANQALTTKGFNLLAANNITLDYIEQQKRMGLSEAEIAFKLGVTNESLTARVAYLEAVKKASVVPMSSLPGLSIGDTDGKAFAAAQAEKYDAYKSFSDKVRQIGMDDTAKSLDNIKIEKDTAILSLGIRTAENVAFWDKSRELIEKFYQRETNLAAGTGDTLTERMRKLGIFTRDDMGKTAKQFDKDYKEMKASGDYTYEQLAAAAKKSFEAQLAAMDGLKGSAARSLYDNLSGLSSGLENAIKGNQSFGSAFADYGTSVATSFTKEALGAIPLIGPMLAQFAGPIIAGAKKLFASIFDIGTAGRDAVLKFAEGVTGSPDINALHDLLIKQLPDEAEKYWIILSQGTGRGNAAQAAANIKLVQDALAKSPGAAADAAGFKTIADLQAIADKAKEVYEYMLASGRYSASEIAKAFQASKDAQMAVLNDTAEGAGAAAAGYKTIADLQLIADKAKAVYEYMRDAGLYSASEIAKAFEASKEAQIGAMGDVAKAQKEAMDKLDAEYKTLSESVAAEAEEEFMGVVETQERARMKQIELEKAANEKKAADAMTAKEGEFDAMMVAGQEVDARLREMFGKVMKVPVEFVVVNTPGNPPPNSAPPPSSSPSQRVPNPPSRSGVPVAFTVNMSGRTAARAIVPFLEEEVSINV